MNKKLILNYPVIKIGIGIDTGRTLVTKVGKGRDPNNSDLIWISKASNHASHLCQNSDDSIIVSPEVYSRLLEANKIINGNNQWSNIQLVLKNNRTISAHKTNLWWEVFK